MWVIAFFAILLLAIFIYAILVKKFSGRNKSLPTKDSAEEEDINGPH